MGSKTWLETAERVLPLVSHVAQVVTVAVTVGGFFFTVIPLYQKAAVDEQVAKQQSRLELLERQVDASYQKIRMDAIRGYVFSAGAECTGLMLPLPPLGSTKPAPDLAKQTLEINVPECMRKELASVSDLRGLKPEDQSALSAAVNHTAQTIDNARLAALVRIGQIDMTRDPGGPLDLDDFTLQQLAMLKKVGTSEQELRKVIRMLNANSIKLKLVKAYSGFARAEIGKLTSLSWPHTRPSSD